jgi:hypothetical protein
MSLLNFFSKPLAPDLIRLPSGSFTLDRAGQIIASTLPRTFPEAMVKEIAGAVHQTFRSAHEMQIHLSEFAVEYAALKVTARELRGGAIVFLSPKV